jgi:hypothetical protein
MKNILKRNKEGGFIELIVLVVIALLLMKYFGVTVSMVLDWAKEFVEWFKTFFKDILK